jgi:DNA-directed RNA polymerase specialized sigma24 family protein
MRGSTLQEVLGHTQFDTTRRYYLDISKEDLVAEHAQFGPLDNMSRQLKDTPLVKAGSTSSALPPADVLLREVKQSNYRAVARKYGVSDTTVRNHLKRAELIL